MLKYSDGFKDGDTTFESYSIKKVTAVTTLDPGENLVHATIPATGTYAINLPEPGSMAGKFVCVYVNATSGGTSVTVAGHGYSPTAALTAVGDYNIAFSTGTTWIEIAELST